LINDPGVVSELTTVYLTDQGKISPRRDKQQWQSNGGEDGWKLRHIRTHAAGYAGQESAAYIT
jgi:hypothetical protein